MRRNVRQRAAACLLALLAQAGLIALILQSRAPQVAQEDDSKNLVFVLPFQMPEIPQPQPGRNAVRSSVNPAITTSDQPEAIEAPAIPPSPATPSATPGIDWYSEMERVARTAVERIEEHELHGDPLNSKPQVMVMPERPHRPGDEERYDDGAVVTWLSERCYVVLDPASLGPRPMQVCKEPTLAERRAEAHRRELEKAMVPEYIRRPVPKPLPSKTRDPP